MGIQGGNTPRRAFVRVLSAGNIRTFLRPKVQILYRASILLLVAGMVQASGPVSQVITTVAGGGAWSSQLGDGGQATLASLYHPQDVAIDAAGNVYIADTFNRRVRKINPSGVISTVAGNGSREFNGDGIAATQAGVYPVGIAVDTAGFLYISDSINARIRRVSPSGVITTVAGNGAKGFSGDGGLAVLASFSSPDDVEVDAQGNLYIIDQGNHRIRKVASNGVVTTVAGNGTEGFGGDGGSALYASFYRPEGIAVDTAGNLYIADSVNGRIRRVDVNGTTSTVAGGGFFGNDPTATNVVLYNPMDLVVDSRGNLFVGHRNAVLMITPFGAMHMVAGTADSGGGLSGVEGFGGDGGPATQARLADINGIAIDAVGDLLIADTMNDRVRKVTAIPQPAAPAGMYAFRPYEFIPIERWMKDSAVGDVSGDGRDDLIFSTSPDPSSPDYSNFMIGIMVQGADGKLAEPTYIRYSPVQTPEAMRFSGGGFVLADITRDGVKDILVAHKAGIELIPGSRSQNFVARSFSGINNMPADDVVAMDVDRDGNMDVVARSLETTSAESANGVGIYFGNGVGGVARRSFLPMPFDFFGLHVGDLNGDGLPDLATGFQGGDTGGAAVFIHDGNQSFLPVRQLAFAGTESAAVALGDFNGDHRTDLVVGRRGFVNQPVLGLYAQDQAGQLVGPTALPTHHTPDSMAVADMDKDGRDDLLVIHVQGWAVGYYQRTQWGLGEETKYRIAPPDSYQVNSISVGDLDHDGHLDAATLRPGSGISLLYGSPKKLGIRLNGSQPLVPPTVAPQGMAAQALGSVTANSIVQVAALKDASAGSSLQRLLSYAQEQLAAVPRTSSRATSALSPRVTRFAGVLKQAWRSALSLFEEVGVSMPPSVFRKPPVKGAAMRAKPSTNRVSAPMKEAGLYERRTCPQLE